MTQPRPSKIRAALAVIVGMLVAVSTIALAEMAGHQIYPVPQGIDPSDVEAVRAFITTLPTGAFVMVLVGWALGALAGGVVATLVARRASARSAHVVGALLLIAAVANMLQIPHPPWFWIAAVILFLPAADLGARLVGRGSAA